MHRARMAFTLIELLVVIAIVAVLSALGMSGLRTVREAALGTRCAGNLHQVALAGELYSQDWDGLICPTKNWNTLPWHYSLAPYVEVSQADAADVTRTGTVLRGCPSWPRSDYYRSNGMAGQAWNSGYGQANYAARKVGPQPYPKSLILDDATFYGANINVPLATVTSRGERPLAADHGNYMMDLTNAVTWPTMQPTVDRHGGRGNVLYFDGHLAKVLASEARTGQASP